MNNTKVLETLDKNPKMRKKIFCRGFVFATEKLNEQDYPFYGNWISHSIKEFHLLTHPETMTAAYNGLTFSWVLIGHAYNPISGMYKENTILEELDAYYSANNTQAFFDTLNQLTGIFTLIWTNGTETFFVGDATCMQTTFYTLHNENVYISSHANLLGDLLCLQWDEYVKRLANYRFFKLFGNSLPGDISQFSNVKRAVPNFYYEATKESIKEKRFYIPKKLSLSTDEISERVSVLLNSNLTLIAQKWNDPAISLTGGCDSKTTLSCAKGLYDKFSYFSYISSDEEKVDAEGARLICDSLGLEHKTFFIPQNDSDIPNVEDIRTMLFWNDGALRPNNKNDVRKRAVLDDEFEYDVEVKSWASEIGRAYYSKRFNGRKNFGSKPTPRKCTTLYKIFLHDRKLVRDTDKIFAAYLKKYFQQDKTAPLEWQEQFFWEFRVSSWNALVITAAHRYSFDITIPYNNRYLLEYLLSAPIDDRISDTVYKQIRSQMNPEIDKTGIAITNVKHTDTRAKFENWYYRIHTKIPF